MRFLCKPGYLLLLFFLLCTCHTNRKSQTEALIYWSANNPDEIDFARYIVNQWNIKYPNEPVQFQPVPEGRSSEEVILAAVVGKTTPDVYSNMWQGDVEFYAQSGVLVPIDTISGMIDMLYNRCDSAVIKEVRSLDGHIYQIPWKTNPIMLLYNEKLFEKIGFYSPPTTFSEYLRAAELFKKDTDQDGYVDRWIGYSNVLVSWWQRLFDFYPIYLAASGGAKLVDGNRIVFDNKFAVTAFSFLQTLYTNNYFSKEFLSARQDVFLSSIVGTRFVGPWEITHAEKFKPPGFEYNFTHLPVPDDFKGNIYTYGDPKNLIIFNTCKNIERAGKFLKYLVSEQTDLKFLELTTQLPRRKNLIDNPKFKSYFESNPKMVPFALQAKYTRGTDSCVQLKEVFDIISQEYEACVIYGVKTPEEAISDAADAAQILIN
jgi:multiple sugar transport system substrate-binding protein